jgi:hypothetical protein
LTTIALALLPLVLLMWLSSHRSSSCPQPITACTAAYSQLVTTTISSTHSSDATDGQHWVAESMSAEEIFRYLHWTNSTSCQFAVDFGFNVWNGEGVAAPDGHKAVCLDKSIAPVYNKCLVYSFGINNQWAFDEAMETFGCRVYSFDPSMGVGIHKRTEKIHFFNIGLSGMDGSHPTKGWNMKTASSIYDMLATSHGSSAVIDILKLDIEWSEWEAIPQMLRSGFLSNKVKQLAVEIHFNVGDSLEAFQRNVRILQDLEAMTGTERAGKFIRFSSRPNPWCLRPISILNGKTEYFALELAWYNSKYYSF